MNPILQLLRGPTKAPRSGVLVRIAVGLIFFSQCILKTQRSNLGGLSLHKNRVSIRTSLLTVSAQDPVDLNDSNEPVRSGHARLSNEGGTHHRREGVKGSLTQA
jgi:hypothetical protein